MREKVEEYLSQWKARAILILMILLADTKTRSVKQRDISIPWKVALDTQDFGLLVLDLTINWFNADLVDLNENP